MNHHTRQDPRDFTIRAGSPPYRFYTPVPLTQPEREKYMADLQANDSSTRIEAIHALAGTGDPQYVPLLIKLLTSDGAAVGAVVADWLWRLGDARAVEPLIKALAGDVPLSVKWSIAHALGSLQDPRAIEPLISSLADEYMLRHGTDALACFGERAVEPLIVTLCHANRWIRWGAAIALCQLATVMSVEQWGRTRRLLSSMPDDPPPAVAKSAHSLIVLIEESRGGQ